MPPRHGKPVWDEELIIMADGSWKLLKEIKIGDQVISDKGLPRKVLNVFIQGLQPCVKIITKRKQTIVAALSHPFLTNTGWMEAKDTLGSKLAKPTKLRLVGYTERKMEEFALAGYLLADGNTSVHKRNTTVNSRFSNYERYIQEDFSAACSKMGFKVKRITNTVGDYRVNCGFNKISPSTWIKEAGLVGTSHTKSVPDWVFQGTNPQIARFLGTYFLCDGTISNPDKSKQKLGSKRGHSLAIEYYSVNPGLIDSLKKLLTMLGIQSVISYKKQGGYGTKDIVRLRITGDSKYRFIQKIYLVGKKAMRAVAWGLDKEVEETAFTYDDVVEVQPAGNLTCRCLEVEEDHTFLVQGYVVHNSELASIRFPAWHLGKYPEHEIINVGYSIELPTKFSRKVREIVRDPAYGSIFPETTIDPEVAGAEVWQTLRGGSFTAAGVGGGITGKGANVLIIDDPLKNQEEADSIVYREGLWEWYLSTAYTRLSPGGGVLVIQTWWHDDDLAGRLQKMARDNPAVDQFEVIKYPAIAENYEYLLDSGRIEKSEKEIEGPLMEARTLLRSKGEALHPERYPIGDLQRIQANLTPRIWSALYQQNPVPDEGMYFKQEYFKYTPSIPPAANVRIYSSWDLAIGEKVQNDFNVGVVLLQDSTDTLYLVEVERFKGDSFEIIERVINQCERWMNKYNCTFTLGVEDSNIWKALKPLYAKRCTERNIYPYLETMKPLTDKIARARPLQGRMQQGRLYLPENASFRFMVQSELLRFPAGSHDDIVDALAWAVQLSVGKAPPRPPTIKKIESWRDKLDNIDLSGTHMSA